MQDLLSSRLCVAATSANPISSASPKPSTSASSQTEALSVECCIRENMNFCNLATDYDGTLAENGRVAESTIKALESLRRSGRSIILVTGRELPQLLEVFDRTDLFDWIVAENGALLYHPTTTQAHLLTEP